MFRIPGNYTVIPFSSCIKFFSMFREGNCRIFGLQIKSFFFHLTQMKRKKPWRISCKLSTSFIYFLSLCRDRGVEARFLSRNNAKSRPRFHGGNAAKILNCFMVLWSQRFRSYILLGC